MRPRQLRTLLINLLDVILGESAGFLKLVCVSECKKPNEISAAELLDDRDITWSPLSFDGRENAGQRTTGAVVAQAYEVKQLINEPDGKTHGNCSNGHR